MPEAIPEPMAVPSALRVLRTFPLPHKLGMLERLFGSHLCHCGVCWITACNGVTWKLDLREVTQRWIVYGDYEGAKQMSWIRHWLDDGGVVIDSGANIGQMVLYLGGLPAVDIHAFEPLTEAYEWLNECLGRYPDWPVKVRPFGLSDAEEELCLQVDGARSTVRRDWYKGKHLDVTSARFITLDEYLDAERISHVRLWKLDVEGSELKALKGAEMALRQQAIDAVLVEVTQYEEADRFLEGCGYRLCRIAATGALVAAGCAESRAGNLVAVPIVAQR